jgi:transcription initiation factor IIE alpha subunit
MAQIKVNAISFAHLVRELLAGESTCEELAERTGLHYVTVLNYTRAMYRAKAIHICAWRMNDHRMYVKKVYRIGDRQDATKPRPAMTRAQRSLRYREKKKAAAACTDEHSRAIVC